MPKSKPYDIESLADDHPEEAKRLCSLVITSLADTSAEARLMAIQIMHKRYLPQVRRAYIVTEQVIIETEDHAGVPTPHFMGQLPTKYLSHLPYLFPWDLNKN